ncbi:hypothetical protein HK105_201121 [Polyrhizophydium stewartii]|uniref:Uncharacterized protein n=1 Tax=Polyrhizophydium stewartii TaxID=2732419 RepID=A0ABR4NIV9_9FUNG
MPPSVRRKRLKKPSNASPPGRASAKKAGTANCTGSLAGSKRASKRSGKRSGKRSSADAGAGGRREPALGSSNGANGRASGSTSVRSTSSSGGGGIGGGSSSSSRGGSDSGTVCSRGSGTPSSCSESDAETETESICADALVAGAAVPREAGQPSHDNATSGPRELMHLPPHTRTAFAPHAADHDLPLLAGINPSVRLDITDIYGQGLPRIITTPPPPSPEPPRRLVIAPASSGPAAAATSITPAAGAPKHPTVCGIAAPYTPGIATGVSSSWPQPAGIATTAHASALPTTAGVLTGSQPSQSHDVLKANALAAAARAEPVLWQDQSLRAAHHIPPHLLALSAAQSQQATSQLMRPAVASCAGSPVFSNLLSDSRSHKAPPGAAPLAAFAASRNDSVVSTISLGSDATCTSYDSMLTDQLQQMDIGSGSRSSAGSGTARAADSTAICERLIVEDFSLMSGALEPWDKSATGGQLLASSHRRGLSYKPQHLKPPRPYDLKKRARKMTKAMLLMATGEEESSSRSEVSGSLAQGGAAGSAASSSAGGGGAQAVAGLRSETHFWNPPSNDPAQCGEAFAQPGASAAPAPSSAQGVTALQPGSWPKQQLQQIQALQLQSKQQQKLHQLQQQQKLLQQRLMLMQKQSPSQSQESASAEHGKTFERILLRPSEIAAFIEADRRGREENLLLKDELKRLRSKGPLAALAQVSSSSPSPVPAGSRPSGVNLSGLVAPVSYGAHTPALASQSKQLPPQPHSQHGSEKTSARSSEVSIIALPPLSHSASLVLSHSETSLLSVAGTTASSSASLLPPGQSAAQQQQSSSPAAVGAASKSPSTGSLSIYAPSGSTTVNDWRQQRIMATLTMKELKKVFPPVLRKTGHPERQQLTSKMGEQNLALQKLRMLATETKKSISSASSGVDIQRSAETDSQTQQMQLLQLQQPPPSAF